MPMNHDDVVRALRQKHEDLKAINERAIGGEIDGHEARDLRQPVIKEINTLYKELDRINREETDGDGQ